MGIKVPTAGRVYNGAVYAEGGAGSDVLEQEVSLKLDTQKHVGLKFGAKEKLLDITDFKERILRPQIVTLSSVVEADLISKGIKGTSNVVTMPANTPSQGLALARGKLNQYLAPPSDRTSLINSPANIALSGEVSKMFNPKVESDKAYLEGYIGRAFNSDVYEHQSVVSIQMVQLLESLLVLLLVKLVDLSLWWHLQLARLLKDNYHNCWSFRSPPIDWCQYRCIATIRCNRRYLS